MALALVMALGVTTAAWADENVAQTTKDGTTTQYSSLEEALNAAKDGGTVELLGDVTLTGNWTAVGTAAEPFKGTFDGKGYTITGLNIPTNDNEYVGLIGMLDGGTVKNVKFASVSVNGKDDVGTAVGRIINGGTVSGVQVLGGTVSGAKRVGGVVGSIKASGTVSDCTNAAAVNASDRNAGGIVGSAYYTVTGQQMYITNCANNGAVTASGVCGGIVSLSAANVSGNTNTAAVSGTEVGGIVGEQKSYGSVTNNTNSGAVTNTGGNAAYGAGGIIGWLRYHGTDEANAYAVSDIISVTGNKNSGSVTGKNDAGGIVGVVYNSAVIMNNKNTATSISATTFAAGIVGNYQTVETPAAAAPAQNKLTFGDDNTSTATLEQLTAQCKDLLIYTNGNAIEIVEVPDPTPEQPPRYYYNSTTTTDTKADGTKGSPKTFDAGVGIYALTAVLSVTGMAYVGKKKL